MFSFSVITRSQKHVLENNLTKYGKHVQICNYGGTVQFLLGLFRKAFFSKILKKNDIELQLIYKGIESNLKGFSNFSICQEDLHQKLSVYGLNPFANIMKENVFGPNCAARLR